MEGMSDKPFRSIVDVGNETFSSSHYFAQREEAEQDAAKVAYENLLARDNNCVEFAEALQLINQEGMPCKVILNDFYKRANITEPYYFVVRPEGPYSGFVASVSVSGTSHKGEGATTEEQAKENAARSAIKSILATRNNCMLEIISSKKPTVLTVQGGQPSETNAPPALTVMPAPAYIPCAPHELMQWQRPMLHMPFLQHEQMEWNPSVARTPSDMIQILHPPQAIPDLSASAVQDDDMLVEVGSSEESISLIGNKRKMDQDEGPEGKQARTSQ